MKKLILTFFLFGQVCLAQTAKLDSLKRELGTLTKQPDGYVKDTLICRNLKALMNCYVDISLDSCQSYTDRMIRLCQKPTLQKDLIYAYQFLGYIHQVKGDHYQSIQTHYKALLLAQKLKQYTRMAMSQGALAHAYISLRQYDRAIKLCEQALRVLRRQPDAYVQMGILNSLAPAYRELGKWDDALRINEDLYRVAKQEKDDWYQAESFNYNGQVYKRIGNPTQALASFKQALTMAHQTGSVDLEGSILLNMTQLHIAQKKWQKALETCKQANQIATHVNNSSVVVETEALFYTIFRHIGETRKALEAHERFMTLKDSLSKERTEQRIESLQAQYDNVQKQNTLQKQQVQLLAQQNQNQRLAQTRNGLFLGIVAILLVATLLFWNNRRLQTKNQEINNQRALLETARTQLADSNRTLERRVAERTSELITANRELMQKNEEIRSALYKGQTIERKRVALELHDNLSSLLSAVNMSIQSINPQNLSEPEQSVYRNVKALIKNAYSEVRNISHNILPAELEKEGLAQTLTMLIDKLNQSSPLRFELSLPGLTERLPVEIEFNVYSIVLELINNSLKHAQANTVSISLLRATEGLWLTVTDDGVGLGQSHDKRGVGLQNIQTRLDALGGTFKTLSPTAPGTRIHIHIPIETVYLNGNITTSD